MTDFDQTTPFSAGITEQKRKDYDDKTLKKREFYRKWYSENKESYNAKYREPKNKEYLQYQKEWRERNKEYTKFYNKEKTLNRLREKYFCNVCQCEFQMLNYNYHMSSNKHKKRLAKM